MDNNYLNSNQPNQPKQGRGSMSKRTKLIILIASLIALAALIAIILVIVFNNSKDSSSGSANKKDSGAAGANLESYISNDFKNGVKKVSLEAGRPLIVGMSEDKNFMAVMVTNLDISNKNQPPRRLEIYSLKEDQPKMIHRERVEACSDSASPDSILCIFLDSESEVLKMLDIKTGKVIKDNIALDKIGNQDGVVESRISDISYVGKGNNLTIATIEHSKYYEGLGSVPEMYKDRVSPFGGALNSTIVNSTSVVAFDDKGIAWAYDADSITRGGAACLMINNNQSIFCALEDKPTEQTKSSIRAGGSGSLVILNAKTGKATAKKTTENKILPVNEGWVEQTDPITPESWDIDYENMSQEEVMKASKKALENPPYALTILFNINGKEVTRHKNTDLTSVLNIGVMTPSVLYISYNDARAIFPYSTLIKSIDKGKDSPVFDSRGKMVLHKNYDTNPDSIFNESGKDIAKGFVDGISADGQTALIGPALKSSDPHLLIDAQTGKTIVELDKLKIDSTQRNHYGMIIGSAQGYAESIIYIPRR